MIKKDILLDGLDCANCALKIEDSVKNIEGVHNASVDFITQKLNIETHDSNNLEMIQDKVMNIIKRIEPDVKVIFDFEENGQEIDIKKNHKEIINLIFGSIILLVSIIFNFEDWIHFLLYILSYLIVGYKVIITAFKKIIHGDFFSEHFLMMIATFGAFYVGEYKEAVAVMLFYLLGEILENMAVDKSRKSITKLMDIRPEYANLLINNDYKKVAPSMVKIGNIILVKPGEKIPLDGVIIEGSSSLDLKALSGEALPCDVEVGDNVLSGSINLNGLLKIKVLKKFNESTASKILELIENASSKKAKTEKFITKFARYYTPIVVLLAIIIAVIPPLVIPNQEFNDWIYRASIFLVVSCPCALILSVPLGFIGGIGGASKNGILIKGGNYLEALSKVETVLFDKTGTLTKGDFSVSLIQCENSFTKDQILEYAVYAESHSNHPIALSIQSKFVGIINQDRITNFEEVPGQGIKLNIDDKLVLVGNNKLMKNNNIYYRDDKAVGTLIHVAVDLVYAGYILLSDSVKEDSLNTIDGLKALGVKKTIMLTGDKKQVAEEIGIFLGLDHIYADLLPKDKLDKVEELSLNPYKKGNIIYVGDGINDAPVLSRADIGIAMGGLGSDAAIEAADVVIMTDEPSKIILAIKIAKRTKSIVIQNIVFALTVKLIFIFLGAFGVATMWEAVFADIGVALIAVLNSMRTLSIKK